MEGESRMRGCKVSFLACAMTSSWGSIPEGGRVKGTESREERKGERETQFGSSEEERGEQLPQDRGGCSGCSGCRWSRSVGCRSGGCRSGGGEEEVCSGARGPKRQFAAPPVLFFSSLLFSSPTLVLCRLRSYCTPCHSYSRMLPVLFLESPLTPVAF